MQIILRKSVEKLPSCYTLLLLLVLLPHVAGAQNKFLCTLAKREKIHSALISKKQTQEAAAAAAKKKRIMWRKESFETNRQCGPRSEAAVPASFGHGFP